MTFSKIILDNIKGNMHAYKEYFLATMLSSTVLSMSLFIIKHPDIPINSFSASFIKSAVAINVIIGVFLFIFLIYSECNFIRHRSRDYALFKILGMKSFQLNSLHFWESFAVFFGGTISGIGLSLLFAKLIFLLFAKLLGLAPLGMYFPTFAIGMILLLFGAAFLLIQLVSGLILWRLDIKKVLLFGREAQKLKQPNIWLALLCCIMLAVSYWLASTVNQETIVKRVLPVTITVIIAMFLFYRQLLPFALNLLSKNKKFYYRGTNLLWISDLKYRIRNYASMLFIISLLMSVGLTGFTASVSVASVEMNTNVEFCSKKYPLIATFPHGNTNRENVTKNIRNLLHTNEISYTEKSMHLLWAKSEEGKIHGRKTKGVYFLKKSELPLILSDSEISKLKFNGDTAHMTVNPDNFFVPYELGRLFVIEDSAIVKYKKELSQETIVYYNYKTSKNIGKQLVEIYKLHDGEENGFFMIRNADMMNQLYFFYRRFYLLLSFYFVLIFYLCAGSMLFFKFYYSTQEERKKYLGYAKVGLSHAETKKSSTVQMAVLFFIPNIFAILNMCFAMNAIASISANGSLLIPSIVKIVMITLAIQLLFFLFLRRKTFI